MANSDSYQEKLPNAPLKEVVFEVHWELDVDNSGLKYDQGLKYAFGVFRREASKLGFSLVNELLPPNSNIEFINRPSTQFRKGEGEYPVLQLGQGVMVVNDTASYRWESSFRQLILDAVRILIDSYEIAPKFNEVSIRYINALDLSPSDYEEIWLFVKSNLQTSVSREFNVPGVLEDISLNETYRLEDESRLTLRIESGTNNRLGTPALIWQNMIVKRAKMTVEEIADWADSAHTTTSALFVNMLNQSLYDSFR